jgi:hypothetical protein
VRRFVTAEVVDGIRAKCDPRGVALPARAFEIKEKERTVGWPTYHRRECLWKVQLILPAKLSGFLE